MTAAEACSEALRRCGFSWPPESLIPAEGGGGFWMAPQWPQETPQDTLVLWPPHREGAMVMMMRRAMELALGPRPASPPPPPENETIRLRIEFDDGPPLWERGQ